MDFKPKIKKITHNVVDPPQLLIGDSHVENVDKTKYLGVIIDKNQTWAEHIIICVLKFLLE